MSRLGHPLRLAAVPQARVWGGQRLVPSPAAPIGELWVVFEQNTILDGPGAGGSLAELTAAAAPALLGPPVVERLGPRFPLLIKLLDTAAWLSLQVHPNDEQAERLAGAGQRGKTEAWHILEAAPGSSVIAGLTGPLSAERLAAAIGDGSLLELVAYHAVTAGDTLFMPAGTIHALGPGLLLYEVQQTSDLTYRVYDWGRADPRRPLHIAESCAVARSEPPAGVIAPPAGHDGRPLALVTCPYFVLSSLTLQRRRPSLTTAGHSLMVVTVVAGAVQLIGTDWQLRLDRLETAILPADSGPFRLLADGYARLLMAGLAPPLPASDAAD
jgi:mannose-6-phosphate isomerase